MKPEQKNIRIAAGMLRMLTLPAAAAILLAACTRNDALPADVIDRDGDTPVRFNAALQDARPQGEPVTPGIRTALGDDDQSMWAEGDRVGIFMIEHGGLTPADVLPGAHNVAYAVDPATGGLAPADGGTPIYYPMDTRVDFSAYHPFVSGIEQEEPDRLPYTLSTPLLCDQTTAEKQAAADLLFSDNACDMGRSNEAVALRFRHLLAKLRLDISLGDGLAGGTVTGVALHGMSAQASFDMRDGTLTATHPASPDRPIRARRLSAPAVNGAAATYTALVAPMRTDNRTIVVTVNGTDYIGKIPNADTYESNRQTIYPVTVKRTGVTVGTPVITPWETVDHDAGTAAYIYTITFDANGGGGSIPAAEAAEETSVSLPGATALVPPADKVFVGWSTAADASGDFYRAEASFTPTRNTTLYAVWSGKGSATDPLLILDAAGMFAINEGLDKHYRLMKDLDLYDWTPLGRDGKDDGGITPFTGTFDGQGHTVTIHSIVSYGDDAIGIFSQAGPCLIRRLCVAGTIQCNNSSVSACGGIVGQSKNGCVIENCLVTAYLFGYSGALPCVGGILGQDRSSGINATTIKNCLVRGNVENLCTTGVSGGVGGIVGDSGAQIVNCVVLSQKIVSHDSDFDEFPRRICRHDNASNFANYAYVAMSPGDVWRDHAWTSNPSGRDGEDCDAIPEAAWWTAPGRWKTDEGFTAWDFTDIWEFDMDGYPRLRVVKP